MYYAVQHKTQFHYSAPISESVMEVRMQPRTEGSQRCLRFKLATAPRAHISETYDFLGNTVHFFDIPALHEYLTITAEALVELLSLPPLPPELPISAWDALDQLVERGDFWDSLMPSPHIPETPLLYEFMTTMDITRRGDPLTLLRRINSLIYDAFDYMPNVTAVDSPIDDALHNRKGVCQDFAHIMIGVMRVLGIPARYISGYLFHRTSDHDRSTPDASHAWVEAYLPGIGWVGFDPTNNVLAGERHIRVASGRDYSDVPPTRGVFKGVAESDLRVEVHITPADKPSELDALTPLTGWTPEPDELIHAQQHSQQSQQQQQ
ncbi:MAG: transglutaminase family protein [Anaerolinea sp.]|nr:transglutaminase family protein [Anaerolinea sp.]